MDCKNVLVGDFTAMLSDRLDAAGVKIAVETLTIALSKYDVDEKCTDLVTIDTESQMMLKKFLATKRLEGRSEKTVERYRYIIKRFDDEMNIPYKDVDVYALRLYLATLSQNGCKDNTINGIRCVFSSFFGWLHDEGFLDTNPAANLGVIKCKKSIKKPYSSVELELIKSSCETLRDRAVVEFLASTGCRINEVTALNIQDIDFSKQECKVLGKGNKERIVYLNDIVIPLFYTRNTEVSHERNPRSHISCHLPLLQHGCQILVRTFHLDGPGKNPLLCSNRGMFPAVTVCKIHSVLKQLPIRY